MYIRCTYDNITQLLSSVRCTWNWEFIYKYAQKVLKIRCQRKHLAIWENSLQKPLLLPWRMVEEYGRRTAWENRTSTGRRWGWEKSKRTKCLLDIPKEKTVILTFFNQWYISVFRNIPPPCDLPTYRWKSRLGGFNVSISCSFPEFQCRTPA